MISSTITFDYHRGLQSSLISNDAKEQEYLNTYNLITNRLVCFIEWNDQNNTPRITVAREIRIIYIGMLDSFFQTVTKRKIEILYDIEVKIIDEIQYVEMTAHH